MTKSNDFNRYVKACTYPGTVDAWAVHAHLTRYLAALGVKHRVVQITQDWSLRKHPELARNVDLILADFARRTGRPFDALDARAARAARAASVARDASDARDARAAIAARAASVARVARDAIAARDASVARDARDANAPRRFAAWCIQSGGWWWWREISYLVTTHIGAVQIKKPDVIRWSEPLFEAFISGAWILHWTEDVLFWVAKPRVHVETVNGARRLHNDSYAAVESDVENLYFWHGVMVPAHVVVRPDWITVEEIERERNAEVRRVMIERFGQDRYILESGAQLVHSDEYGALYRKELADDEPLVCVHVINSTPEPTGESKRYMLRVPPTMRTARDAVAWTFGLEAKDYTPTVET